MARILIVDDEPGLRDGLAEALIDLGHETILAENGAAALRAAAGGLPDAALLDLRLPDMDGLDVLCRLREQGVACPVAILTAHADAANTIAAMRLGAFDHLTKPIGRDELAELIGRMLRVRVPLPGAKTDERQTEPVLIGCSPAMREVQKAIGLVADSDATVLLTGETGTGKEVVARAIHRSGRRGDGPFIAINCAAIPVDLLESSLFGHVKGAFTGALADHTGAFRDAKGGTLLLDEIGDMDTAMQAKILRVLQERVVTPIGGKPVTVDVRIIAATHRDLSALVQAGRFREDLYYRLNVIPIHLPPLRDRPADIIPLATHILSRLPGRLVLAPDAEARLIAHPWRGNVRELRNTLERAAVLARDSVLSAADFAFLDRLASQDAQTGTDWTEGELPTAIARLEAHMIARALHETGGNRAEAARRLGIHRQLLYAKARRYGLAAEASASRTEDV